MTKSLRFSQTNITELFRAIKGQARKHPRDIDPGIPVPLEAICLKALEKNHVRRRFNAESLLQEVQGYIEPSNTEVRSHSTAAPELPLYIAAYLLAGMTRFTVRGCEGSHAQNIRNSL